MPFRNPTLPASLLPQIRQVLSQAYPELAAALEAVIDDVCERHVKEVIAQFPAAAGLDHNSALDDLPSVLDGLAEVFARPDQLMALALLGPAHASARDGQGFSLMEVFGEYVLLRRSLLEHLEMRLSRRLTPAEAESLQSAMDGLIASTLESFTSQRRDRLQLETNALGHFLSSLSHDLRNEINGVITTLQSLEENAQELRESLERAGATTSHEADAQVLALIQDVGDSRRTMESTINAMTQLLEAERLRHSVLVHPRDVVLEKLMQSVARSAVRGGRQVSSTTSTRTVERIKVHCPQGLRIWTDPDLLGSVLVNLMGNAVRHAPDGDIHFSAEMLPTGGCQLLVRDEGPGIAANEVDRLFDKFERGTRSPSEGLGLGLFIARRAADLLGGRITVKSEVGVGSTFIIELPARPN